MTAIAHREFLLEIGTEEIPARMTARAAQDLRDAFASEMANLRLECQGLSAYCTPRRLILHATGVPERQEDRVVEKRGPAVALAFDAQGKPTKAAEGFARGAGVAVDKLETVSVNGTQYIAARKLEAGQSALEILPGVLVKVISGLRFPKSMRWGCLRQPFVRPVHWLLALLGGTVIPFEFGGIVSSDFTYGHRFLGQGGPLPISSASEYSRVLGENFVVFAPEERKRTINERMRDIEGSYGMTAVPDEGLLDEVTHLVEFPVVASGKFDTRFLKMPPEVLITSMRTHQKFFALQKDGKLTNRFLVVSNTKPIDIDVVVRGNERVLAARLSDALFFFTEDRKRPLEANVEALAGQTFLAGLGSMKDKTRRLEALAGRLARVLSPSAEAHSRRAALLCKADLATQVVGEFPELQGVMGREYALASGEESEVARAIYEHYLPRQAGDTLPDSEAGVVLALADRLDTLVGCFHLGLVPTATKDPYALRRGALACLRILVEHRVATGLSLLIEQAIECYPESLMMKKAEVLDAILEFMKGRLKAWLATDHATEVVDACLTAGFETPWDVREKVKAVEDLRGLKDYESLIIAFKRVINITAGHQGTAPFSADVPLEPAEKALWDQYRTRRESIEALFEKREFSQVLDMLRQMKPAVDQYFDEVLVMSPDMAVRDNRLAMLSEIGRLFLRFADFTKILV